MFGTQGIGQLQKKGHDMSTVVELLRGAFEGCSPLTYLLSPEEDRVTQKLAVLAEELGLPLRTWTCVSGLDGADHSTDPVAAIKLIIHDLPDGIYLLKDLSSFMSRPEVVRILRDAYYGIIEEQSRKYIFILAAEFTLPESLQKEVHFIEIPPPGEEEIRDIVTDLCADVSLPEDSISEVILALKGLAKAEIRHVMNLVVRRKTADKNGLLDEIFAEKKRVVKKSGFLEFSPPRWDIEGIGGLDNMKEWLMKRQHMFKLDAVEAGVPVPKGLLVMGISGCGKSLAVKTISSLWNIPMFRLDMNLVFSGMYGPPEEAFHKALRTIEAVAPAVLWVDEIENALGIEEDGLGIASHIFSTFLTWMQEKPPLVFIAATANRIQALPAEIIRKGRFDQVFFCDLPTAEERKDIFQIHLLRNGADLELFDFKMLTIMTEGWNGAEIEQAVISARTDAFFEKRQFDERDLGNNISKIVPLSDTMEVQIKRIRSWAFTRAAPASKYSKSRRRL